MRKMITEDICSRIRDDRQNKSINMKPKLKMKSHEAGVQCKLSTEEKQNNLNA